MDINKVIDIVHSAKGIITDAKKAADISLKGAADYVTAADKGVQAFLEEKLTALLPGSYLFAEEKTNERPAESQACWILDPVDGTTNLIHGYQMSAISLALYESGRINLAVVYNPFTEETFYAAAGGGSFLNGRLIRASACSRLCDALVCFGSSPYEKERAKDNFPVFQRVFEKSADFRRSGSAALDLCYVAAGRTDVFFERNLKPWDYGAGRLIAQQAGAVCTNYSGKELPFFENSDVLCCTPALFEEIKKEIN